MATNSLGGLDSRMDALFPNLGNVDAASGLNSDLIFGSTSSAGANSGGFGTGQTGTGVASDYQAGTTYGKASSNYYGAATSAIATIGSTLMQVAAKKDEIEHKNKEILTAMEGAVDTYEFQASIEQQQKDAVDRVVGDKMSENGLDRLKNKATLKASAAMTGTSGGTTANVVNEASIIEMMDNAVVVAQGRQQKANISRQLQADYISMQNRLRNLQAGMMSPTGVGMTMIDASLQGFTNAYKALPASEREKYFGYGA